MLPRLYDKKYVQQQVATRLKVQQPRACKNNSFIIKTEFYEYKALLKELAL